MGLNTVPICVHTSAGGRGGGGGGGGGGGEGGAFIVLGHIIFPLCFIF